MFCHCARRILRKASQNAVSRSCATSRLNAKSMQMAEAVVKNVPHVEGKLMVIEGNIAAGKSTLTKRLGEYFNCVTYEEPAPKNPYLAKFYKEPKKYALKLQLWLFEQRYLMYLNGLKHILKTGQNVILDRSVYSDLVFTNVIFQDGNISDTGYHYYLKLRDKVMKDIPPPFVVIYLRVTPEVCFERIVKRGREYEQAIPLEYLDRIGKEHDSVFSNLRQDNVFPVITYDWSQFGRDVEREQVTSDRCDTLQLYISGFNKITADIEEAAAKRVWQVSIPERLMANEITSESLKAELMLEGYEKISQELPKE